MLLRRGAADQTVYPLRWLGTSDSARKIFTGAHLEDGANTAGACMCWLAVHTLNKTTGRLYRVNKATGSWGDLDGELIGAVAMMHYLRSSVFRLLRRDDISGIESAARDLYRDVWW